MEGLLGAIQSKMKEDKDFPDEWYTREREFVVSEVLTEISSRRRIVGPDADRQPRLLYLIQRYTTDVKFKEAVDIVVDVILEMFPPMTPPRKEGD